MNEIRKVILAYGVVVLALVAAWESVGSRFRIVQLLLSRPSLVVSYVVENGARLLGDAGVTILESVSGLAVAAIASLAVFLACLYVPPLMKWLLPVMLASQVIPTITLAPFVIILLGTGVAGKIFLTTIICFFPIFVGLAAGYRSMPSSIGDLLWTYSVPLHARIWRVYLPLSLPSFMSGLRVSSMLAVIGAVVAEFVGAERGLGKNLFLAAKRLEPELMVVSGLITCVVGLLMYGGVAWTERLIGRWYAGQSPRLERKKT